MATLQEVIDTTLTDYLLTGQREPRNVLNSAPDTDDTTLTLLHSVKGAQEGARLSIGFEDTYVVSSDPGPKTVVVIRAQFGSTAAAHAVGDTVWVNPKWSQAQILRAVNAELDSLSGQGLFQMATKDLTFSSPVAGYDLDGVTPDDVIDIYEVRGDAPGPQRSWQPIEQWTLVRDASATDFPSGLGLILHEPGHPGFTVRVTYKKRFAQVTAADAATDLSDASTSAGLDREAHDLLALGAAIRLVAGAEVRRSQLSAQPDTRRSDDVPPGATLQSVTGLVKKRDERLREERARLARRYPARKAVVA